MKIAPDKWKHFFVGLAMGAGLQAFFGYLLRVPPASSFFLTLFFSAVVGYGFELYSRFTGRGHYEVMDAVAVVLGALLGSGAVIVPVFL